MPYVLPRIILFRILTTRCQIEKEENEDVQNHYQNLVHVYIISVLKASTALYFESSFKNMNFNISVTKI